MYFIRFPHSPRRPARLVDTPFIVITAYTTARDAAGEWFPVARQDSSSRNATNSTCRPSEVACASTRNWLEDA
jgi:hypothetical protein